MTQVHWQNGLFLQPQHLQMMQRGLTTEIWAERRLALPFAYGVIEARLARDDLADQRVRFDKLVVAMRSGTIFRFPHDAVLPTLDIREAFRTRPSGFVIGLGLPLWNGGGENTIEHLEASPGQRIKRLYRVAEHQVPDENDGGEPVPVQVRKLNGMLMFEDEDRDDMEFLPLIRVVRQVADDAAGLPRVDSTFVPPSLQLAGTPVIFQLVRDLTSQISATRDQTRNKLANTTVDLRQIQGAQFELLSNLRCLTRAAALLPALIDDSPYVEGCAGRVPLFEVYLALRDLLAEFTALYPGRGVEEPLPYDHDDPYPPFQDLDKKIRLFLSVTTEVKYRKIEFHLEDNVFVGDIPGGFFNDATGFHLSIETPTDPTTLARFVEDADKFKLIPVSYGLRALRGLVLREERSPPVELPMKARQYFFRLVTDDSGKVWRDFQREPQALVHFDAPDMSKYRITLFAVIPGNARP